MVFEKILEKFLENNDLSGEIVKTNKLSDKTSVFDGYIVFNRGKDLVFFVKINKNVSKEYVFVVNVFDDVFVSVVNGDRTYIVDSVVGVEKTLSGVFLVVNSLLKKHL